MIRSKVGDKELDQILRMIRQEGRGIFAKPAPQDSC